MLPDIKCLLVDDLEENLLALSSLLKRDGVEVLKARSGAEALELLLVNEVALAFLDVQMPEMDGFELAELMRGTERTRAIPIIFITAGEHDQRRVFKGYESGAVDFLHKPLDSRILKNKADVFFQLHRQNYLLQKELEARTESLRFNEMFTAILGHDLRDPLNTLVVSAQLIEYRSKDPVILETTQRMLSSGRRMNRMIGELLDLTRARLGGGIPIKPVPADLGVLAEQVINEFRVSSPGCEIEFQTSGKLAGSWDRDRISQVIANLLGNALRYGKTGEIVRVVINGSQAERVDLAVVNAGSIAKDLLPHIFDPFRRGERLSGNSDALGLGLYIVQQFVIAHGGTVAVRTAEGEISFLVQLPRQCASMAPPSQPVESMARVNGHLMEIPAFNGKRA